MSSLSERKARLIVHGDRPYNAEPPLDRLRTAYRTPAPDFYVRSHGDLPALDRDTWRLTVDGDVGTAMELSLRGLRSRFREVTVTATMQCAGNRRADMRAVAPVSGDPWDGGAIGTADWTGVRLGDVLREAGAGRGRTATSPSRATTGWRVIPTGSPSRSPRRWPLRPSSPTR